MTEGQRLNEARDDRNAASPARRDDVYYAEHEPSLGELLSDLSRELTTLVREEAHLAQVEMTRKAKTAVKDIVYLAVGGFIAYAGFIMLLVAAIIGLSYFMGDFVAALIVGVVVLIIGGVLIMRGKSQLQNIDPVPQRTVETLKEDKEFIKRQVK